MIGPVKTWLNEQEKEIKDFPLPPSQLAAIINLIEEGKLSFSAASGKLFHSLIKDPSADPGLLAKQLNLLQESDAAAIEAIIEKVLEKLADKVAEYKKGKKGLIALFVGEVMKETKGTADPKLTNQLLLEKLK
jgi:aspartyl-tRNA(Asn)/glutamyl-tRNA(Gln) amidotransferase subunit B